MQSRRGPARPTEQPVEAVDAASTDQGQCTAESFVQGVQGPQQARLDPDRVRVVRKIQQGAVDVEEQGAGQVGDQGRGLGQGGHT